jgi:two-component system, NarL family, invasion response regulator UvrY
VKILVVEDHPIFQQGLSQTIRDEFAECSITTASSAREAMQVFPSLDWNLVIMDLSLPDGSGLDVLKEMKIVHPKIPVLVLTLHSEDRFAVRAFRAGVDGYLTKESSPSHLGVAIRKILAGGKYVSANLAERLAVQLGNQTTDAPHELLSDREYQVLGLLAQGRSVGSIAKECHLSINTISTYRARILSKLDLKSTAEIITYAIRHNLSD